MFLLVREAATLFGNGRTVMVLVVLMIIRRSYSSDVIVDTVYKQCKT